MYSASLKRSCEIQVRSPILTHLINIKNRVDLLFLCLGTPLILPAVVGVAFISKVEYNFLDWIPIDNRFCTTRFNRKVKTLKYEYTSLPLPKLTDYNSNDIKDEFYRKISGLKEAKLPDVVIMGDFNT